MNAATGNVVPSAQIRIIVVQWMQGTAKPIPVLSDMLTEANTTNAPISLYQWDTRSNFVVLWDRLFMTNNTDRTEIVVKKYIKINRKIAFLSGSTNAARPIFMFVVSEWNATNFPAMYGSWRITFKDA